MRSLLPLLPLALAACLPTDPKGSEDSGPVTGTDAGDLVLSPGFEEESRSGTASGAVEYDTCEGWFPDQPQLTMTLESNFLAMYLQLDDAAQAIRITSDFGDFCSDTDSQPLPTISRGTWSAGVYEIFVGAPTEGYSGPFQLAAVEGVP